MFRRQAHTPVLALDRAGNPHTWISAEDAVRLLATDRVIAPLGEASCMLYGGTNRVSGLRSSIEVNSILLTKAKVVARLWARDYVPPLTNRALFQRDGHVCQYCAVRWPACALTRDHIVPRSQGGADAWTNVTTACRSCNQRKGARTPEQWGAALISVPYAPCYAEHLLLMGRNILADQDAFVRARVRRYP